MTTKEVRDNMKKYKVFINFLRKNGYRITSGGSDTTIYYLLTILKRFFKFLKVII